MVIQNLAPSPFSLSEGSATLQLPSGISLAPPPLLRVKLKVFLTLRGEVARPRVGSSEAIRRAPTTSVPTTQEFLAVR